VCLHLCFIGQHVPQTVLANRVQRFHACAQQLLSRTHQSKLQGITVVRFGKTKHLEQNLFHRCKTKPSHCQQLPSHYRTAYPCVASSHTCCCGIACRIINPRLTRHSCYFICYICCYICLTLAIHASGRDLAFHLCVQDLSPILPGPIAQDAALVALRQAVLQCISDMARRVGDSLHLLEALGGIVGKLPGPNPLTTAVLECVASAAMAVNYFSPKVNRWGCCWGCLIQVMHACRQPPDGQLSFRKLCIPVACCSRPCRIK